MKKVEIKSSLNYALYIQHINAWHDRFAKTFKPRYIYFYHNYRPY